MSEPRIILWDIESLPNLKAALEVWPQLSSPFNTPTIRASVNSIACAAYKVLNEDKVYCLNAWDYRGWQENVNDDKELCENLYAVLLGADCVVTHNGIRFDWKFLQTRLIKHKLPPLPKIHHVDTCSEAKKNLLIVNNRLQTVAKFLTDQEKMTHEGWDLWVKVHSRDPEAMQTMSTYCKQDVVTLEAVFKELKPVISTIPNHNLFNPLKAKACPNCGSSRLRNEGKRYTQTRAYRRYICEDCRKWSRTDISDEAPRSL